MPRRLAWLLLLLPAFTHAAEKPALEHLYPVAGTRGQTNEVTLFGKFEPWPPKGWASAEGVHFQFSTNKGKANVAIDADAPTGPCLVRFFNDEGPSDFRIFVVSPGPETLEIEPNNHFNKAQPVPILPTTVNGRLEKNGDVDSYTISLKGGQWMDAAVDSYTLLAKLDPVLRLVTTNGYQLAWNHDFASLDPRIVWQAPYDLTAVIQVFGFVYPADSDIRLSGGSAAVYRLHLAASDQAPSDLREKTSEQERNDTTNDAPRMQLPFTVVGTVCPIGDTDRFQFSAEKDQGIEVELAAASIGSPLDAWIAIENGAGKELARNDDANNSRDPGLKWKAPEAGSYFAVVGSATHQGSIDCRYHLSVSSPGPDYRVTSAADALIVSPGTTNTLKLNLKRIRGFTNSLTAKAAGLPAGVTVESTALPSNDGEAVLAFVAATNSSPYNGTFHVEINSKPEGGARTALFDLVSRSENNGVPGGYSKLLVESTDQLWLTVKPKEPSEKK